MRHFIRPHTFDLVLNLYTSFGFFDDPGDNRDVLRNVFTSLKTDGVLVLDVAGKEVLARVFQPTGSKTMPNGNLLVQRRAVIDDWSKMDNQ